MPQLLTTDQLAMVYHVANGTIRRWASEDKIRAAKTSGRRKLFSHDDFQRAYEQRHPENAEQP